MAILARGVEANVGQAGRSLHHNMKAGGIATSRCKIAGSGARERFDVLFLKTQDHVHFIHYIHFIP
jgi:hypothetical protein